MDVFNEIFRPSYRTLPAFAFVMGTSLLMLLAAILSWRITLRHHVRHHIYGVAREELRERDTAISELTRENTGLRAENHNMKIKLKAVAAALNMEEL